VGPQHQETLRLMSNLGGMLQQQGRYGEAETLLRTALEARRATLGSRHPDTLTSVGAYAAMLVNQGKLGEAEPLLREALETSLAILGVQSWARSTLIRWWSSATLLSCCASKARLTRPCC
jgi:Tfp pilus assembly protein PilF